MAKNTKRPGAQKVADGPDAGAEDPKRPKSSNPAEDPDRPVEPNPITDPQESMKGPVSSFMQGIKHKAEKNDDKEEKEHDYKQHHSGGDFINK